MDNAPSAYACLQHSPVHHVLSPVHDLRVLGPAPKPCDLHNHPTFAAHVPFEAPHAPGSSQLRMSEGPPDLKVSHVAGPQVVRLVGQSHDGPLDKRHGSADLEISAASESL